MSERLAVKKTYKLAIGGRSPARRVAGHTKCWTPKAGSSPTRRWHPARMPATPWSPPARHIRRGQATAYNRGQVLYRVAEMMEGRRAQFVDEVAAGEGVTRPRAERSVDEAIDRWVWYAGWADKIAQVMGSSNPVAGPYFDFSVPEATGVVAVLAPRGPRSSAWCRFSRRWWSAETRPWSSHPNSVRCRPSRWPRSSVRPTSRAGSSTC